MTLYLDDDCAKAALTAVLRRAGHRVILPRDAGTAGASDPRHLAVAVVNDWVMITRNYDDFMDLHTLVRVTGGKHPGVLVVRLDNDPNRDMKDRDIARSIANLEKAAVAIANELHVLNHWR